jgi:transposase-like protein
MRPTSVGRSQAGGGGAAGKSLVLIAVEDKGDEGIGRIRLRCVANASAKSLVGAVQEMVTPGSTVRTDEWPGYGPLESKGYVHTVVHLSSEPGKSLLPLAHRVASLLKRWLLGTHQGAVRPSHLGYYLDEYTFRFNRRTSRYRGKLLYLCLPKTPSLLIPNQLRIWPTLRVSGRAPLSSGPTEAQGWA